MNLLLLLAVVQVWQPGAPMVTPGWGMACAAVGDRVYCIGGKFDRNDSLIPRLAVEAYDVVGDSWITGFPDLPAAHCYPGCAVLDGKIYVVAGSDGAHDISRVDRFDPSTSTWDTVASLPYARNALAACVFDGALYAAGGLTDQCLGDFGSFRRTVWKYWSGTGAGSWNSVDSLDTPRACLGLVSAGDRLNAVGGMYFSNLKSTEYYRPNAWTTDARMMQSSRSGPAVVSYGSTILALGGYGSNSVMQSSAEMLDVEFGPWTPALPMDQPRAYLGAAMVGNQVVVIGGMTPDREAIGSVLVDSTIFSGVEENGPRRVVPQSFATVVRGHARIDYGPGTRVEIYDGAGNLAFKGTGPTDTELTPGVYFVRAQNPGLVRTGRITVVR